MATRLLDWSQNPLVACYFACCELPDKDAVVYILESPESLLSGEFEINQFSRFSGAYGYIPNSFSPRVLYQKGLFTVHCDASSEIEIYPSRIAKNIPNLTILQIPAKLKAGILEMLSDYGINRAFLFPDLDGLSVDINQGTLRIQK